MCLRLILILIKSLIKIESDFGFLRKKAPEEVKSELEKIKVLIKSRLILKNNPYQKIHLNLQNAYQYMKNTP